MGPPRLRRRNARASSCARAAVRRGKWHVLNLDYYEACDSPINEIEVCDDEHDSLAVWLDDDMRLRLAARDLLNAVQKAVAALNTAPRFAVQHLDTDSYAIAAECDRAIGKATKGGAA
jgi:hypothetical protein